MSNAHPIDLAKTPSFRLDGRRALVTGGGRGIGLAAASALAHAGAQVTLAARTKTEVEQAASAICARGGAAEALVLDVTDVEAPCSQTHTIKFSSDCVANGMTRVRGSVQ
jgi:NAD(P)-dependent dehydrogenase (short-subunit alcohol dehydrogenase family)